MKKALLTYGIPNKEDNPSHFQEFVNTNLRLMSQVAQVSGYAPKIIAVSQLDPYFEEYQKSEGFLFGYVGHGEGHFLGAFPLKRIVRSIEKLPGEKMIVLDSCTDTFVSRYNPHKGTTLVGAFEVPFCSPISASLYDAVIARKTPLEFVIQETLDGMKHNWVKIKRNSF